MPDDVHDSPQARNTPVWRPRGDTRSEKFGKDPYEERHQPKGPTVCTGCGAVFAGGRWTWADEPPSDAASGVCPACRRIGDQYPAGYVTLESDFFPARREEILNMIRNEGEEEGREHPLHRIIDIQENGAKVDITTTDVHLARRIGEALERAYQGEFDYSYAPGDHILRGTWTRTA